MPQQETTVCASNQYNPVTAAKNSGGDTIKKTDRYVKIYLSLSVIVGNSNPHTMEINPSRLSCEP
jgi:hypothetical protein